MCCVYDTAGYFAAEAKMIGRRRKIGARIVYEEGAVHALGREENKKDVWEGRTDVIY